MGEWCFVLPEENSSQLLYIPDVQDVNNAGVFILEPYTIVEVADVCWQTNSGCCQCEKGIMEEKSWKRATAAAPHSVTLRVVESNSVDESVDLPLAPWR